MLYFVDGDTLKQYTNLILHKVVKSLKDNNYEHNGRKIGSEHDKYIVHNHMGFVLDTHEKSIWFTQEYTDECDNVYILTEKGKKYIYEPIEDMLKLITIIKGDTTVYNKFGEGTEVDIQALAELYDERDKLQNQLDVTNENIENIEKSLLNYLRK